ncbi:hypothetical protein TNCV_1739981 [Trichonephila clavipes]|nr:hypothetical protein TNCV_1739981 [Trichonephila clavipes]
MTSSTDWSERTDLPEPPKTTSPSRIIAGDDHIAEFSDLFREAIQARNVYAPSVEGALLEGTGEEEKNGARAARIAAR